MLKKSLLVLINLLICFLIAMFVSGYPVSGEHVNNGAISIVFDDNYDNQISNAWSLMEDRGLVGTFYVLTSTVNTPGYMSFTDLQTLQAAGNEIASHSVSHTSFTFLEEPDIRYECSKSKTTLEEQGLTINNIAYPNGDTTGGIDNIVSEYFRSGRTAYISPYLVDLPADQFRLPGFSNEDENNELELLMNMVDQVYNTQTWSIFLFHNIIPSDQSSDYTTSLEDFEAFLDYIVLKGLPTLTINQGLDVIELSMNINTGTVSPSNGKYTLGSEVVIEAFSPVAGVGERFVWEGWSGSGVGSYSGFDNPATITLTTSISQTALWRHEYLLTVSSDHSQVEPSVGEHWYEAGSEVVIEAFSPVAGVGERFVWEGWSGSGVGSYSGFDNPVSIIMNDHITEIASWKGNYNILFNQNGIGSDSSGNIVTVNGIDYSNSHSLWVDEGSVVSFSFSPELFVNNGKKYVWTISSGLSSQQSDSLVISDSGSITANYKFQYYVEVISPHGVTDGSGWYDSNEIAYATLDNLSINETENIRYIFSGWTGDSSGTNLISDPMLVNTSLSIIASWQKQYLFTFNHEGLPLENNIFVTINSENQSLPYSVWITEGDNVEFTYPDTIPHGFGSQYKLILTTNPSPLISNSPSIITATYSLQSNTDLFIMITIFAIFAILILVIVLLRKRNMI